MRVQYCARCGRVVKTPYRVVVEGGKLTYHGKCYRDLVQDEEIMLASLSPYLRLVKERG